MSEETKKQETMEDFMEEINASFSNFRDDDMLIWDKLVQMQEDKTEFELTVEGIVKGGVHCLCGRYPGFYSGFQAGSALCRKSGRLSEKDTDGKSI